MSTALDFGRADGRLVIFVCFACMCDLWIENTQDQQSLSVFW